MRKEKLTSSEEAQHLVMKGVVIPGTEFIPFQHAKGRILAEDIYADRSYPPFNRATMDGIALRFADIDKLSRGIPYANTAFAGRPKLSLPYGEAIKIMTGAPVPDEAELVIQVEQLSFQNDQVFCDDVSSMKKGQFIHADGSDIAEGERVLNAEKTLTTGDIACLATLGKTSLLVHRVPAIGIITTGDELVHPNQTPLSHQIRSSNRYFLESMFNSRGAMVQSIHLHDELDLIKNGIESLLSKVDCLILCGGVSKGDKDHVYSALDELGANKVFHRVAQKPGKPLWFGYLNNKPIFGLPGNPLSVAATSSAYILPFLFSEKPEIVELAVDINFKPNLTFFCPGICFRDGNKLRFMPSEFNTSGDVLSLSKINGFLELPASKNEFKEGEKYRFYRIDTE